MMLNWHDLRAALRLLREEAAAEEAAGRLKDGEMRAAVVEGLRMGLDDLEGRTPESVTAKVAVMEAIAWDPAHPHRAEALVWQGTWFEDAAAVAVRRGRPAEEVSVLRGRALDAYSTAVEHLVATDTLAVPRRRRIAFEAHTLAPARLFWMSLDDGDVERAAGALDAYRAARRGGYSDMVDQTRRMKTALREARAPEVGGVS